MRMDDGWIERGFRPGSTGPRATNAVARRTNATYEFFFKRARKPGRVREGFRDGRVASIRSPPGDRSVDLTKTPRARLSERSEGFDRFVFGGSSRWVTYPGVKHRTRGEVASRRERKVSIASSGERSRRFVRARVRVWEIHFASRRVASRANERRREREPVSRLLYLDYEI